LLLCSGGGGGGGGHHCHCDALSMGGVLVLVHHHSLIHLQCLCGQETKTKYLFNLARYWLTDPLAISD
jgi:hypothetical protein